MVSVLIVTYNSSKEIASCVRSFYKLEIDVEIIIVDNHSSDETVRIVKEVGHESDRVDVRIIENEVNDGFSRAMNQAFKLSRGEYVLSFNPDAEMKPGVLEAVTNFMEEVKDAGMTGVAMEDEYGQLHLPGTTFPRFNELHLFKTAKTRFFRKKESLLKTDEPFEVEWLTGTGFLIRKSLLSGLLYPEFSFLFWEEYYLAQAIKKSGNRIYVLPRLSIIHHISTSFKFNAAKLKMARLLSMSHEYRVRNEHYGWLNANANNLLYAVDFGLLSSYIAFKRIFRKRSSLLEFLFADYKFRFLSATSLLLMKRSAIMRVDEKARSFFNAIR